MLFDMAPMLPSESALSKSDIPDLSLELERKAAELGGTLKPLCLQTLLFQTIKQG